MADYAGLEDEDDDEDKDDQPKVVLPVYLEVEVERQEMIRNNWIVVLWLISYDLNIIWVVYSSFVLK